jgi:hypothetical protein
MHKPPGEIVSQGKDGFDGHAHQGGVDYGAYRKEAVKA